ncbi:MAG: MBL fold metallo-hydrolase [Candidatus Kapabacteria bacterium]|nr:MBL fold metallo-hydrolase [Candidatus Kapabacteria bacterium]
MKALELNKKLNLRNDGKLEIIFIGSGTAFSKVLHNNNIIIIKGDKHILVDFGLSGPMGLKANTGLDLHDIETVLPTHSHSDHIGGLELLTLTNRYIGLAAGKPKLELIITKEYQNLLWDQSLRGGLAFNEINEKSEYLSFNDYYNVISPVQFQEKGYNRHSLKYGDINLEFFRTNHVPDSAKNSDEAFISYGLMIDDKVLFSGDTKFDLNLVKHYGKKAEIIFHDCSFKPNPVHASLEELKSLDSQYRDKMMLMHYSDDYEHYDVSDFKGLVKEGILYQFD